MCVLDDIFEVLMGMLIGEKDVYYPALNYSTVFDSNLEANWNFESNI